MNALIPVPDALASLVAHLGRPRPVAVPLADAVGLVLAADLRVDRPVPPVATALRPGHAVRAADTVGAGPYSPLLLPRPERVTAGGELPAGTDAVLPDAFGTWDGGAFEVTEGVPAFHWARRPGGEVAAGTVLRRAGERLRALDAAVALAAGLSRAEAFRPVVGLAGGGPAHAVALSRLLAGTASLQMVRAGSGADDSDLLVVVGRDEADAPGTTLADGLALRPGEETRISVLDGRPILSVAARLDALLAVGWALLGPALATLTGAGPPPSSGPMPLTRKIASTVGLTEIALLRRAPDGFEPLAVADLTLGVLARADHWLAVPPGSEGFEPGALVSPFPV